MDNNNFKNKNLYGAYLTGANLAGANLAGANLAGSDLTKANLTGSDLTRADLMWVDLMWSDLSGADLTGADLTGADLTGADLYGADLTGIKYDKITKYFEMRCPEIGEFIGYKKAYNLKAEPRIVKLKILASAKRSSATTDKCRCSEAEVLSITDMNGNIVDEVVYSSYDHSFVYKAGNTLRVENFENDRWVECAPGIHFFMTRKLAENYCF